MGWGDVISIGLGLGNAALNAANASTLQQMKLQQAGEALYREFIDAMRNGIFNLKQAAEGVLAAEGTSPLQAAGAMRILDYQLSSSGVTPDLFPDLADKEYAAATARLIGGNSNRLYAALDKAEQAQVDQLVEHIRLLPDCRYYVENADQAIRLREAQGVVDAGGIMKMNGCLLAIVIWAGVGALFGLVAALGDAGLLLLLAALVAAIPLAIKFRARRREVIAAQKTVKELEGTVDLQQFQTLEHQFKSPEEAQQLQQQSEQYVESFFGDYTLLQDGWRS